MGLSQKYKESLPQLWKLVLKSNQLSKGKHLKPKPNVVRGTAFMDNRWLGIYIDISYAGVVLQKLGAFVT